MRTSETEGWARSTQRLRTCVPSSTTDWVRPLAPYIGELLFVAVSEPRPAPMVDLQRLVSLALATGVLPEEVPVIEPLLETRLDVTLISTPQDADVVWWIATMMGYQDLAERAVDTMIANPGGFRRAASAVDRPPGWGEVTIADGAVGEGPSPAIAWDAVEGAGSYVVVVNDAATGRPTWSWSVAAPATTVFLGGGEQPLADDESGAHLTAPAVVRVVALDATGRPVAVSDPLDVTP